MKYRTHRFDSLAEFIDSAVEAVSSVPPGKGFNDPGRSSFYATSTFEEAVNLARNGWQSAIAKAETLSAAVSETVRTNRFDIGFQQIHDVEGGEVDISLYLSGVPECMVAQEPVRISRHGRAVRLVVPIGFNHLVKVEQAQARGAAVLALLDLLGKFQHPTEVWAVSYCTGEVRRNTDRWIMAAKVHDATDPIDIGALAFALAHPAMLRRLTFAIRSIDRDLFPYLDTMGSTDELTDVALSQVLPSIEGTEIRLRTLQSSDRWNPTYSATWIEQQVARIFD